MDHLPLPNKPTIEQDLEIPLLCKESYDGGEFLEYPQRHGWEVKQMEFHFSCHGRHITPDELGAFLQIWLFFGLVFAFTGENVDVEACKRPDRDRPAFMSTSKLNDIIGDWTQSVARQKWSSQLKHLEKWRDNLTSYLLVARDVTLRAKHQSHSPEVDLICMSLAALAEYLHQAIKHVFFWRELNAHTPVDQHWRLQKHVDCGEALYPLMRRGGWCPSRIARLDSLKPISVSALWFYANMTPPNADENHDQCSREQCQWQTVMKETYSTVHTQTECKCSLLRPDHEKLAASIDSQALPLISLHKGQLDSFENAALHLEPYRGDVDFVAISHVWSDGHGNPLENALPACFLHHLVSVLEKLPGCPSPVRFWLDTLCVPVKPVELRKAALLKMKDSFEKASSVLVLDSYLQSFEAGPMAFREVFARVETCGWMQRLWTFQEGRMGRRLFFQFKDVAVELAGLVRYWQRNVPLVPLRAPEFLSLELFKNHSASVVFRSSPALQNYMKNFYHFRYSLRGRCTSKAEDEPLCLANLMELDLAQVLASQSPATRMEAFWRMMPNKPYGLIFSEASRKLTKPGMRWAPATLMGDIDVVNWVNESILQADCVAVASERGLNAQFPGMTFKVPMDLQHLMSSDKVPVAQKALSPTTDKDLHHPLLLTDNQGAWFNCFLEKGWHQDNSSLKFNEAREVSIILAQIGKGSEAKFNYDFRPIWSDQGLLVTHRGFEPDSSTLLVNAHRHVLVQKLGHKVSQICELLKPPIAELFEHYYELEQKGILEREDLTPWTKRVLQDAPRLRKLLRERENAYGLEINEDSVWKGFLDFVHRMIQNWPQGIVWMLDVNTQWCVD